MKKYIRFIIFVLALALTVAAFVFASFAETEAPPAFTVYGSDGNPTGIEGNSFEELCAAATDFADGDTVVLNADLSSLGSGFLIQSTEDAPRRVGIDLNGHKIYVTKKIGSGLISVGSYTTLDVYSSVAGAVLYSVDTVQANMGGSVFNVRANSAVLNVGDFTKGDVTYPGSNLTTYSAALIDIVTDSNSIEACDADCRFNVNGGSYYSVVTDYSGFIIPRGGEIIMNITDANIISMESKSPINSAGSKTVLNMTNCRIFQYQSQPIALFNSALGTVNMKDCITSYALKSSQSAMGNGVINLEGRNVFAVTAEGDYYDSLLADCTNKANVTTYADFELARGGSTLSYFDSTANFNRILTADVPKLAYPSMIIDQADVVKYKFVKSGTSMTQNWSKDEPPTMPYELPVGGEAGVYRYGWQKSVSDDGVIVCKVGLVADFNLKIRAVYDDGEVNFKIYIPAAVIDGEHIDYSKSRVHGETYPAGDWVEETIDGAKYYYAESGTVYPEYADEIIEVKIVAEYGSGINVDTTWSFTLRDYIDAVLATEADGTFTAEQYEIVKQIAEEFFAADNEPYEEEETPEQTPDEA